MVVKLKSSLAAFDKIGFDQKQLKESSKPLYGFCGKRIEPVRAIALLVSFGTPKNLCTEYITFDIVNMTYPYNTIFRRGMLNTFEVVLHSATGLRSLNFHEVIWV
jgi:hypothetical protein